MPNSYYDNQDSGQRFLAGETARGSDVDAKFDSVEAGFDQLPAADEIKSGSVNFSTDSGTANSYVLTSAQSYTAYTTGQQVRFIAGHANTGGSVINLDGLGNKSVLRQDGTALRSGDIPSGAMITATYNGTAFLLDASTSQMVADAEQAVTDATAQAALAAAQVALANTARTGAETAETNAETAQAAAEAAQAAAELALDQFTDTYLGAFASAPTLDNDGDPLSAGDVYFNTTDNLTYIHNGTSWVLSTATTTLPQLTDVTLTSPSNGDALTYNGSVWVNTPLSTTFHGLTDTNLTATDNYAVTYDSASGKWVSEDLDARYYTETETDTLLSGKQPLLVSGSNIKTVNGVSLLGSGDISAPDYLSVTNVTYTGSTQYLYGDNTGRLLEVNFGSGSIVDQTLVFTPTGYGVAVNYVYNAGPQPFNLKMTSIGWDGYVNSGQLLAIDIMNDLVAYVRDVNTGEVLHSKGYNADNISRGTELDLGGYASQRCLLLNPGIVLSTFSSAGTVYFVADGVSDNYNLTQANGTVNISTIYVYELKRWSSKTALFAYKRYSDGAICARVVTYNDDDSLNMGAEKVIDNSASFATLDIVVLDEYRAVIVYAASGGVMQYTMISRPNMHDDGELLLTVGTPVADSTPTTLALTWPGLRADYIDKDGLGNDRFVVVANDNSGFLVGKIVTATGTTINGTQSSNVSNITPAADAFSVCYGGYEIDVDSGSHWGVVHWTASDNLSTVACQWTITNNNTINIYDNYPVTIHSDATQAIHHDSARVYGSDRVLLSSRTSGDGKNHWDAVTRHAGGYSLTVVDTFSETRYTQSPYLESGHHWKDHRVGSTGSTTGEVGIFYLS